MNIRFLETVIKLSELHNFRLTAEHMNITPAAISNRIAAIEQEIGAKLFRRGSRDVLLTPEGAVFLEAAHEIVDRYDRLIDELKAESSIEGSIRIGVLPSIGMTMVPDIVSALRDKFPKAKVSIRTASSLDIVECLNQGALDVALTISNSDQSPDPNVFQQIDVCSLSMNWIASANYPIGSEKMDADELLHHPIISYEMGSTNYVRLSKYLPYGTLKNAIIHHSNSLETTINMIDNCLGISVIPAIVILDAIKTERFRILEVHPQFPKTDYAVFFPDNSNARFVLLIASAARSVAKRLSHGQGGNLISASI